MQQERSPKPPPEPIISTNPGFLGLRDTLENSTKLLEMLEYMRLTDEWTQDAEYGFFLMLESVVEALQYVSRQLDEYEVDDDAG